MTERTQGLGDFVSGASLWLPAYMVDSPWVGHAPFLFWLIEQSRPRRFVELGTHRGYSYFAACEAVQRLGLDTDCIAVDHWQGDEHAGFYGGAVFHDVKRRNEAHYGAFSRLIRARFSEALPQVEDGTVDLLHVDGRHFYEDVKEDFEDWRPKLSERAVVLFHDTAVRERGFGVHRYWAELAADHPSFTFHHSHGLGVLCPGRVPDGPLGALLGLDPDGAPADAVRALYRRLGAAIADRMQAERARRLEEEIAARRSAAATLARVEKTVRRAATRTRAEAKRLRRETKAARRRLRRAAKARGARALWDRLRGHAPPPGESTRPDRPGRRKTRAAGLPAPPGDPPAPELNATERRMADALALGRAEGWLAAEPAWEALWQERRPGEKAALRNLLPALPPVEGVFEDVAPRAGPAGGTLRWCIYTTLFGRYDTLQPPLATPPGIPLICFADHDVAVAGWTTVRVPPGPDPLMAAKAVKILPFAHLANYEASLFVDANTLVHGDVARFVDRWCADAPFVVWRHDQRSDVYEEAEAILALQKSAPAPVLRQVARYEREGLPRRSGLAAAGLLWRRHDSDAVRGLMAAWWDETTRESPRDQLSLPYVIWKTGVRPRALPARLGSVLRNPATSVAPHRGADSTAARPPGRRVAGARRKVAFLWEPGTANWGSTLMRGRQLSRLVAERLGERYDVSCLPRTDAPSDSVLILTKGCLARATPADLHELRARSIALVADVVDAPFREDLADALDLAWASSIGGLRDLLRRQLPIEADMVTHHVDPRIEPRPRQDLFSVGYFGNLVNAVRSARIERTVRFHDIDQEAPGDDWIAFAGMFPMHYALRPRGGAARAFKPFLKGFTAARCNANIIVDRADGDALAYLGDDYPFLADAADEAEALRMLAVARDAYGTATWREGLAIMDHVRSVSSDAHVAGEVRRSLSRF